jgi:hypothetical protein
MLGATVGIAEVVDTDGRMSIEENFYGLKFW